MEEMMHFQHSLINRKLLTVLGVCPAQLVQFPSTTKWISILAQLSHMPLRWLGSTIVESATNSLSRKKVSHSVLKWIAL